MRKKVTRRARRGAKQWSEILGRFESSGASSREFCRREGLALSSFQRWRTRLGSGAAAEFVELVPAPSSTTGSASDWSVEVALPNGVQLRLRG